MKINKNIQELFRIGRVIYKVIGNYYKKIIRQVRQVG